MNYLPTTSYGEIGKILPFVLEKILSFKTNGTFVEIGANDGKTGSFTYNLANIGWNGYYCEPIPELVEQCKINHAQNNNVHIIPYGCGEKEETLEILYAGTLSSIDNETINHVSKLTWAKNNFKRNYKVNINIKKLDTILQENNITNIDLLIIDVEGFEENVLKGFTLEKYIPSILIIEISDTHPDFLNNKLLMDKFKRIRNYLKEKNYILLANDIVDNIYLTKEIYSKLDINFIQTIKGIIKHTQYIEVKN
tara:strand:+ start:1900 stop:2655 length:756 start_codon:yes stop_codon:yes gene_type:complete